MYNLLTDLFNKVITYNGNLMVYFKLYNYNNEKFLDFKKEKINDNYVILVKFFKKNNNKLKENNSIIEKFINNIDKEKIKQIVYNLFNDKYYNDINKEKLKIIINYELHTNYNNSTTQLIYFNNFSDTFNFELLYLHYLNIISLPQNKIDELIKQYKMEGGYHKKYLKYINKLFQLK
jgi:hypothetical protein